MLPKMENGRKMRIGEVGTVSVSGDASVVQIFFRSVQASSIFDICLISLFVSYFYFLFFLHSRVLPVQHRSLLVKFASAFSKILSDFIS